MSDQDRPQPDDPFGEMAHHFGRAAKTVALGAVAVARHRKGEQTAKTDRQAADERAATARTVASVREPKVDGPTVG